MGRGEGEVGLYLGEPAGLYLGEPAGLYLGEPGLYLGADSASKTGEVEL